MSSSLCRTGNADELFVAGAAQNRAKALCAGCPVRAECLAYALDERVEYGVWGGMTERERRALLRRRPTVESWAVLLSAARRDHDAVSDADGDAIARPGTRHCVQKGPGRRHDAPAHQSPPGHNGSGMVPPRPGEPGRHLLRRRRSL
ncbi:WhiB family transcriptional regulator [Streptomyces sp. NPDC004435]|uniref:WhiB family transcriptional regulator n=1 Tax=Streptomyces sp. NPDC004435 TaxID=3364701 RepID=UPI0036813EC7